MLGPFLEKLNSRVIILASGSPRRREILDQMGLKFKVVPSTFEENLDKSLFKSPQEYARKNSELKALQVAKSMEENGEPFDVVVGCDTIVTVENLILEKPKVPTRAKEMLTSLSGKSCCVYSGLSIVIKGDLGAELGVSFIEGTDVRMAELSEEVIDAYVATGEPLDKAGAFGIQGIAASFIKGINGDYYNVVGFPMHTFSCEIVNLIHDGKIKLG